MSIATGKKLGMEILDALGIDSANASGLEIKADANGAACLVVRYVIRVDSVERIKTVLRKYSLVESE